MRRRATRDPWRRLWRNIPILLIVLGCAHVHADGRADGSQVSTHSSYARGIDVLERSWAAHGGNEALVATRALVLEMEGTLDRGARHQGLRPGSSDPGRYTEWLVIDEENDRLGHQQYHERYDGAVEWWRFVYLGEDRMKITIPLERFALDIREPSSADKRRRLARAVPIRLLADAMASPESVRHLGSRSDSSVTHDLVSAEVDGATITLVIDQETRLVRGVEMLVDETLLGDALVEWRFDEYDQVSELGPFPSGYEIHLGGRRIKDVRFTAIRARLEDEHPVFSIPDGIDAPAEPPPMTEQPGPGPSPRVIERAPWVWQVGGIRSGFNVAFFELDEYVVVFEAPAGWLEIHEIPAANFVDGVTSSSTSEELIRIVRETIPDKPIRYVILSHFHGDHAGGARAFVAEGATIVTTAGNEEVLRKAMRRPHRLGPDALGGTSAEPKFHFVEGETIFSDGEHELRVIDNDDNPHVESLLSIWLPEERMLFVADLFHATRLEGYPQKAELPLQLSFVRWIDRIGIEPLHIYGVHGGAGTPAHLEKLRESGDGS